MCLINQATRRGSGGIAPPFLTSVIDEGVWSASRPDRFIAGEDPPVPIG
jgi:hypothetical protein